MEFAPYRDAIYTWFSEQSGITTIWAEGDGPRPDRPYASLKMITGAVKLGGQDNLRGDPSGKFRLNGPRSITVSCNVYGDDALEILTTVRDSLDDPAVIDSLDAQGVAVSDDGNPQNVTEALETIFEQRAQMDVRFEIEVETPSSIGSITKIGLDGNDIGF